MANRRGNNGNSEKLHYFGAPKSLQMVTAALKCSLGISNCLEEISSLSHSTVFLYFFALITEEGFFISPCYSLELCFHMGIYFLSSFAVSLFSQLFVRPPHTIIVIFAFLFLGDGLDHCFLYNVMNLHS